jgi:hypothetical protein
MCRAGCSWVEHLTTGLLVLVLVVVRMPLGVLEVADVGGGGSSGAHYWVLKAQVLPRLGWGWSFGPGVTNVLSWLSGSTVR